MFNRSSFSHISFSRTAWSSIQQDQQTGRSGYWRLFYYQLQEASLKTPENPVKVEEVKFEPYAEQPDGSVIFGKVVKPKTKAVPTVNTVVENYVAETMRVHHQVQMLLARLQRIETNVVSVELPAWMTAEKLVVDKEEDEEELLILLMS